MHVNILCLLPNLQNKLYYGQIAEVVFWPFLCMLYDIFQCCECCSTTNDGGTAIDFSSNFRHWTAGTYKLHFEIGLYFQQCGMDSPFTYTDVSSISLSVWDYYVGVRKIPNKPLNT